MGDLLDVMVDCVAAYRLTRLVTADGITARLRDRIVRRAYRHRGDARSIEHRMTVERDVVPAERGAWSEWAADDEDPPRLAELIVCRWCAGVWVAAAVTAARLVWPRPWRWAARGLTVAAGSALIAGLERD